MLVIEAAIILVFWLMFRVITQVLGQLFAIPRSGALLRLPILIVIAYVGLLTAAEWRRAIIFTQTDVVYRPAFGELSRVSLKNIVSLNLTSTMRLFCLKPTLVSAVELILVDGQKSILPLDFFQGSEMLTQLCRLTNLLVHRNFVCDCTRSRRRHSFLLPDSLDS
jgi:hypothetical protein